MSIILPVGVDLEGKVHREATLVRPKGRAMRTIASIAESENPDPVALYSAILDPCWTQVGDQRVNEPVRVAASIADSDFLIFQLVKLMRGPVVTTSAVCPQASCAKNNPFDVEGVNIDELEVTGVEDDAPRWIDQRVMRDEELERALADGKFGPRVFEVKNEEVGFHAVWGFPQGVHRRKMAKFRKTADVLWYLTSATCLMFKSDEGEYVREKRPMDPSFLDNLDYVTLEHALGAYKDGQPGVNSSIDVECPSCGHVFSSQVQALSFFLRGSASKD